MKLRNKKTGEIGKLHCDMNVTPAKYGVFEDADIRGHYWEYHSLAELNEAWEDYKPAEPLIKDEKIRKAVRAWAEAVDTNSAYVEKGCYENDQFVLSDEMAEIHFRISTPEGIRFYKRYTIAELCGEDEE